MSDTFQTFFLMQNMYFSKILKFSGLNKGKKCISILILNQALLDTEAIHSRAILCGSVQQIA